MKRNAASQQPAPGPNLVNYDGLRAVIQSTVQETVVTVLAQLDGDRAKLNDRLAYSEHEAAALLGLEWHQLRDERRRGRVSASVGPGRKIMYTRQDLLDYLHARRWDGADERV